MERLRTGRMRPLQTRQMQRHLLDPETQTFLLVHLTAAARLTTFALASNSGLSTVWLKSGRRTLGAIRQRIDLCWHHRRPPDAVMIPFAVAPID